MLDALHYSANEKLSLYGLKREEEFISNSVTISTTQA